MKKHREKLSNVLNNKNPRVCNDLEAKVLGIGTVLYEVLTDMDQITEAYVKKLEAERDEAQDCAADLDIECQELREQISLLLGELIKLRQEHGYPIGVAS